MQIGRRWNRLAFLTAALVIPIVALYLTHSRWNRRQAHDNRLTLIAVWTGSNYQSYFRNLISSARLNSDSADLLIINRIIDNDDASGCLNLSLHGIDISNDENIRFYCLSNEEWVSRHLNFLCSSGGDWDCDDGERDMVAKELMERKDRVNCEWKPFRGFVFRDLFLHPKNPLWAWTDLDMHFGRLSKYPFELLSQSTFITGSYTSPIRLFLAGQFTAFNLDDPHFATAWKELPSLNSPQHFTERILEAHHKGASDESFWSSAFMRADAESPGRLLTWHSLGDLHGQDWFDDPEMSFVVSGHDVLQLSKPATRLEMEAYLNDSRLNSLEKEERGGVTPPRGALAWLSSILAAPSTDSDHSIEQVPLLKGSSCGSSWIPFEYSQCIEPVQNPSSSTPYDISYSPNAPQGTVNRHWKTTLNSQPYSERLFLHFQWLKLDDWFEFPPFDILDQHIMWVSKGNIEVFEVGSRRNETLFRRRQQREGETCKEEGEECQVG